MSTALNLRCRFNPTAAIRIASGRTLEGCRPNPAASAPAPLQIQSGSVSRVDRGRKRPAPAAAPEIREPAWQRQPVGATVMEDEPVSIDGSQYPAAMDATVTQSHAEQVCSPWPARCPPHYAASMSVAVQGRRSLWASCPVQLPVTTDHMLHIWSGYVHIPVRRKAAPLEDINVSTRAKAARVEACHWACRRSVRGTSWP